MGIPPTGRYCLGIPPPKRTPCPPATTIAPTSRGKSLHQLIHVIQSHQRCAGHLYGAAGRAEYPRKTQPHRFGDAALDCSAGSDLAAEPDLAQKDNVGWSRPVVQAGYQGSCHREVSTRLVE